MFYWLDSLIFFKSAEMSSAPLAFMVVRADQSHVGPISLARRFVTRWGHHIRQHPTIRWKDNTIALGVSQETPVDSRALALFGTAWEVTTVRPEITAESFIRDIPLPLDADLSPQTVTMAWQLSNIMRLTRVFRLLLSVALRRLTPESIWDYLGACGNFNRPSSPRDSYEWRLRSTMRPMVGAFVPWLYFCLRPSALEEYRTLMQLIARSEPTLIEETLPPLLDGMSEVSTTGQLRNYQARATIVTCDACACARDPHSQMQQFAVPDINIAGVHGPLRCRMIARPSGVRVFCQEAPQGIQYGMQVSVYDTSTFYGTAERRALHNRHVAPNAQAHTAEETARPQARFHGTCYQCGRGDVPVYIVQLFVGLQQEMMPTLDTFLRACQTEVAMTSSRSSASTLGLTPQSPATPIG